MLYSAFLLGLVSSLHCLGMCGPIALALPVPPGSSWKKTTGRLLYNCGRMLTYALLGLLMGFFGQGLLYRTQFDNWFKIKVIKGDVLQVVKSPSEKAFPRLSRLVFKGL